ncbi:DNA repair protein rhp26 [Teratosphaeriaceae sp. CCFEE 6253]|nr:DNA repair protein rhp26 [Teratosphaeriaceae sp. CCFEE 6253]
MAVAAASPSEAGLYEPPNGPAPATDEATVLASLTAGARDQDDLERSIGRQADALLTEQADERDNKRLEKTSKSRDLLQTQIRQLESKLVGFGNHATKEKWRGEVRDYRERVEGLDRDAAQIRERIDARHADAGDGKGGGEGESLLEEVGNKRMPGESQREFLIRTGKITPFSKMGRQLLRTSSSLGDVLMDAEEEGEGDEEEQQDEGGEAERGKVMSHQHLLAPGFEPEEEGSTAPTTPAVDAEVEDDEALARRLQDEEFASERPAKRRRLQSRRQTRAASEDASTPADDSDVYVPGITESGIAAIGESGDDGEPADEDVEGDFPLETTPGIKRRKGKAAKRKARVDEEAAAEVDDLAGIDDGDESVYQERLRSWVSRRRAAREKVKAKQSSSTTVLPAESDAQSDEPVPDDDNETAPHEQAEWHLPHPTRPDAPFDAGFRIPGDIFPSLFDYQKTGVQWLWELYSQQVGGIIGDEMGLGKTIQIISFLAGLHYSGKLDKPIIVVCPATVMKQWVNEFHRWWPPLRVSILHTSGSGMLDLGREGREEDDLELESYTSRRTQTKGQKAAKRIVDRVVRDGHVLVTTYSGLQTYAQLLIPTEWGYAVLDEGHKIRNPNTAITIYCKELRTHNRVILSGTPMQNNLTELWSLFDFVFPMRLGTLVTFRAQFDIPIKQGGYANASNLQVETAKKCAETLKDAISPYLLQRFKVDVAADLPKKSERVLFCRLTKLQRDAYEWFLQSEDMRSILAGKRQALYGVDILRKICNHPDLVEHRTLSKEVGYKYGEGRKSGKMQVVKALLEIWKRDGHKTLVFAQHRIMLDILEPFVREMKGGIKYVRMDGNTSIKDRQSLVDRFNADPALHVFLLTTKVGGLGVNLTGADRVIIYDPDWNPSTDVQARERAWRLGQKREVEIYRLMTAGTIEEKIYHRQIFKQFLTNKVLRDPGQRQTFQLRDLGDLFTLGESREGGGTETGSLFRGTEVQLRDEGGAEAGLPTPPEDEGVGRAERTGHAAVKSIAGVSRQEDYRGNKEDEPDADADPAAGGKPTDHLLTALFARNGVQSALEHDAIINGPKPARVDAEAIGREARRVAAEAARELRKAGEVARTVRAGEVTWTGLVGTAGRPHEEADADSPGGVMSSRGRGGMRGARGGAGPSSAAVLANLASRQIRPEDDETSSRDSTPGRIVRRPAVTSQQEQPKGRDFLVLIRDFLRAHDGKAYTQMLIEHFNRYCGTPQRTAEFKEMLKVIASLEKGGRGRGRWVLKGEYR